MAKLATVYDVAKMAGVSRGTVDRVLFGRGRVSEETEAKVRDAIRQLNYIPNHNASCLALKRELKVATLLPEFKPGDYWELLFSGFTQALNELNDYNIIFEPFFYNIERDEVYSEQAEKILASNWDVVITHAASKDLLVEFSNKLKEANIPVALIDNKYDDMDYMMYSGIDNYKSGILGAFLLTAHQDVKNVLLLRVERHTSYDPNAPRRHGIIDYLTSHLKDISIHNLFFDGSHGADNRELLDKYFAAHPQIKHVICPNSRVYMVSEWFKIHKNDGYILVGYDDLEQNLDALRNGSVEFLVTRQIPEQSKWLLMELARCIMHNIKPNSRNRFVHMDILHRNNIDYYR